MMNPPRAGKVGYELSMKFKRPARLGDVIEVVTSFTRDSAYRGRFTQRIECSGERLVEAEVDVVCVDARQELREFPEIGPA